MILSHMPVSSFNYIGPMRGLCYIAREVQKWCGRCVVYRD